MNLVILPPTELIKIGDMFGRYNPKPKDIDLEYLEIRLEGDTIKLVGQNAIYSTIQKVDKLDWRLIVRAE